MWIGIAAVVVLWDTTALQHPEGQTGSEWYLEQFERRPLRVGGLTLLVVCHLVKRPRRLMSRYDPIGLLAQVVSGLGSV